MNENSLIAHLEDLRKGLIRCFIVTALLYPLAYLACPYVISALVEWSFPAGMGGLHYFAPMEVFWVQLRLALILSLVIAYPWNIYQLWRFLLPALYEHERKALGWWVAFSSFLFICGVGFCVGLILPLLMKFSVGFATEQIKPVLGLAGFLELSGWLMLAFGLMFQAPTVVFLAVRFGVVSCDTLRSKRPYVVTGILIVSAVITPPDIVSQVMLALPTWLLFELGLILAGKFGKQSPQNPEDTVKNI